MNPAMILMVAILVFALLLIGLLLTYREFQEGAPKKQELGKEDLRESPHSDV